MAELRRIRIDAAGETGRNAHVYVLDKNGEPAGELPVTRATVTLDVDGLNRATLEVVHVAGRFDALLEELIVEYRPSRRWWRFWR